jgi:hypothetical protein
MYTIRAHVDGLSIHEASVDADQPMLEACFQYAKDYVAAQYGFAAEGITVDAFNRSGEVVMSYTFAPFNDEVGL